MASPLTIACLYENRNRNSFNALLGALETDTGFTAEDLCFPTVATALSGRFAGRFAASDKVLFLVSLSTLQALDLDTFLDVLVARRTDNMTLVAGGPHPSALPRDLLDKGFDLVVVGEGERPFLEIVRRLGRSEPLHDIPGTARLGGGDLVVTPPEPPESLDRYPSGSCRYGSVSALELTRGCPYQCAYCQTPHHFCGAVRHRSIESACRMIRDFKLPTFLDFRFVAPNALGYGSKDARPDVEFLGSFLKQAYAAAHPGRIFFGSFPSEIRPDSVTEETAELLQRFTANDELTIGLQSGSDRLLRELRRGHTAARTMAAVETLRRAGFRVNVDVIFGLPGETEEDLNMTLDLADELVAKGARIHAHGYIPLPGSPLWPQPPVPTPQWVVDRLRQGVGRGTVFGYWEQQMAVAGRVLERYT